MMNESEILKKVEGIFWDVFDDDDLEIGLETSGGDIEDWDSLSNINLVVAMEKEFSMKFSLEELGPLKNVGDMVALIGKKLPS